ncbi:MAG TPA: LamG domain-containing protein [Chthoniobacter sp.]|jgi:hypothetical protein
MKDLLPIALGSVLMASSIAAAADSYREVVLADKPFAYYRLGESSNKEAVADELGNNPGSYVNEPDTGVPGAILTDSENTAVKLARSLNQYIYLTPLGAYGSNLSSGFSVEYWLKTANSTDHQNVFGTANAPGYRTDFLVDIGYAGAAGRLRLYCRDNRSHRFEIDFYPEGKNINIYDLRWHHIVHVYDPKAANANDRFRFYIDGERQDITVGREVGVPAVSAFTSPMTLGSMDLRGDVTDSFDGALDEVAFYTAPLSGEQVAKHYQAAGYHEHEPEPPRAAH